MHANAAETYTAQTESLDAAAREQILLSREYERRARELAPWLFEDKQ